MTFTADMAKTMTEQQIIEFWRSRERARRDQGLDHYETLINPATGKIVAKLEEAE